MTRPGKCDVCRRRKVKCDEKQPVCGACSKGNRSCTYTAGNGRFDGFYQVYRIDPVGQDRSPSSSRSYSSTQSRNSGRASQPRVHDTTLTLRPAAYVPTGSSTSTSYGSVAWPGSIDPSGEINGASNLVREAQLCGRPASLVLRWRNLCETMLPGAPEPYVLGEWLEIIPQRIGHSETFDIALECLITSALTYVNTTERNLAETCALNSRALARIRAMLSRGEESPKEQDDILLAISFLYAAEVFRGVDTVNYKIHMRGRDELLANTTRHGTECSEICRQTFFTSAQSGDMTPILAGKDSIFDKSAWLALTAPKIFNPEYPDAERVEEYLSRFLVRLPRLVRLVRTAKQTPNDEMACVEAVSLATHLYLDTLEDWIQRVTMMDLLRTVPTTEPSCVAFTARSLEFASARIFKRIVLYWRLRCLVSGCILTLLQVRRHMPASAAALLDNVDATSVQSHEERAAECIVMSVQWAIISPSPFPVYKLLVVSPLMNAFGVWMRSARRASSVADAQRAKNLQLWAVDQIAAIGRTINAQEVGMAQLEAMNTILMGGPLPGS